MTLLPSTTVSLADIATAWLLTYLIHSTLLLGLAWLGDRLLPATELALRERLWRFALLAPLLTCSLQLGLDIEPRSLRLRLPAADVAAAPATIALPTRLDFVDLALPVEPSATAAPSAQGAGTPAAARTSRAHLGAGWAPGWRLLPALWLLVAAPLLLHLALRYLQLRRRLRLRFPVAGQLRATLDALRHRARFRRPVALACAPRIAVPLARGVVRPEICLPPAAVTGLDAAEQGAVLAHELAHHVRRDPAWLLLARLFEGLLFFQPLNRLARHRLRELAEYRCDDWAVACLGRSLDLARSLTAVAGWQLDDVAGGSTAWAGSSFAAPRSDLRHRVQRLLDPGGTMHPTRPSPSLLTLAPLLLAITLLAAPGVSTPSQEPAPPPPEVPQVPESPATAPSAVLAAPAPPAPAAPALWAPPPAPAPPAQEPSERQETEWREVDAREEGADDELEAALEMEIAALEEALESLGEAIEGAFEPFEEELEQQLEALEETIESTLERELEGLQEQIETLVETELEGDPDPARLDAAQRRLRVIEQSVASLQPRLHASLQRSTEVGMRAAEMSRGLQATVHRVMQRIDPGLLAELSHRLAATHDRQISEEERAQLRAELRRITEQARLSAAQRAELEAELARARESLRIDQEQLDRARAAMERQLVEWRARLDASLRESDETSAADPR